LTEQADIEHVKIPYSPRWYQKRIHADPARFKAVVWHRRAGKTVAAINELIKQCLIETLPNPQCFYVAPTYSQAKRIAWKMLHEFTHKIPDTNYHESELRIDLPNNGMIQLLGAEKYDAHRGVYADFCIFDEPALQPPGVFGEVFRPALADRKGGAWWIGTPAGKMNEFYRRWTDAQQLEGWSANMMKITDTAILPLDELQAMRREMSEREWRQEMLCDFAAGVRGSYYQDEIDFLERNGRIQSVPHDPALPVFTSWDLGLDDQTVIVYWQQGGIEYRIIDCDVHRNKGLSDIIRTLMQKPYTYADHYAPHDIKVRDYTSGQSRIDFAGGLGVDFTVSPNLSVADGIQAVRSGLRKCVIDNSKCFELIEALRIYRAQYDERNGVYRDKPFHGPESDFADAVRYFFVSHIEQHQGSLFGRKIDYSNENKAVI
jgi:hypothetical protein